MTGAFSYRPEETGEQRAGEITRTRHRRLNDRYRVLPWPEDCTSGWSVCTTPCTVSTFNASHRRRHSFYCHATPELENFNEWERNIITDVNRFKTLSKNDSHRILIWREKEAAIIPRTSFKGTGMEVAVFSFGEASCLVVVQTFTSSTQVQSTGPVIVTRFFFHMCVF
ncbi:hypothetical protein TNCV_1928491 [Trichonephila clavipes]|nr:hypothetical protein TNCV_1928491 [Trichonephila clavipes]